ncbi:alpha/beta fold hydrolase [Kiritimatiellota bacterium B12222]|nr:alpha/beta fold hydrolase [Kiritimatiellota bacterium B12222]
MKMFRYEFGGGGSKGLWLHGWMGSGEDGKIVQAQLGAGTCLCCPDLPGHGNTPLAGWRLMDTLAHIAELAQGCRWVGGYSMGGRLLMMAAAKYPEAFHRLVIESASLGLANAAARTERRNLDQQRADQLRAEGLNAFCRRWYQMEMWGGFQDFPERKGEVEDLAGALMCYSVAHQPDLRQWITTTPCRMLWIAGQRDRVYVEQADWVKGHTRHDVRILDAGHNVHAQQGEAWAEAVGGWLNGGGGGAQQ